METIRYEIDATTARLNRLNGNDSFRFVAVGKTIMLRDVENFVEGLDSDSPVNPMVALSALERADAETRNYGMPGLVF